MPPPPRHRAPHLQPVQSRHRNPQALTSNPTIAGRNPSSNPYQSFLSQQQQYSPGPASSGHSPLQENYPQPEQQEHQQLSYRLPQSHYNIPGPNSPIDGSSNPFINPNIHSASFKQDRLDAEARQRQYRLQNEDGDSVIDYYNHNTGDERGVGGGLSSANLSPVDHPHGQAQHSLLWLHHQQKIAQQLAAAQQKEIGSQKGISEEFHFQEFPFDNHQYYPGHPPSPLQHQQQDCRLHTSHSSLPPATPTSTTGSVRENIFPPGLERELSHLSVEDRGAGSPRSQGFSFASSKPVQRVIEQPSYPKVPKLTSSPVTLTFGSTLSASPSSPITATKKHTAPPVVPTPSPTVKSKIHPNAPNPTTSPPSLPPPSPSFAYTQAQPHSYRQLHGHILSSPQVEEDLEGVHSGSETESEADSHSSADEEEEDEEMSSSSTPQSWITNFCSLQGHEYFAEVSEEFIEDDFNLTGLSSLVPLYKESLEMILDVEPDEEDDVPLEEDLDDDDSQMGGPGPKHRRAERTQTDMETLESQAELLYGLIHQRFITSRQGMQIMYEKYQSNHFGFCPRVFCNSTRVLPCGYSDTPGVETVKLYCPSCVDIYVPPNSRFLTVDGAFFGTTFPTLFFLTFPDIEVSNHPPVGPSRELAPSGYKASPSQFKRSKGEGEGTVGQRVLNGVLENNLAPGLGKGKMYEMRIYGFKVSERAKGGPRMKWLRGRPDDVAALDEYSRAAGTGQWLGREDEDEGEAEGRRKGPLRRSARRRG